MPQFILNAPDQHPAHGKACHPFYTLDEFARGYVEAMFFTNGDTADENDNLLNEMGVERLTRAAVASIKHDCGRFTGILHEGRFLRQWLDGAAGYDDAQAGRDLWFTRQGHGVGFDDREELNAATKAALYTAARQFGEANVETSRGWIYHR